MYVIPKVFGIYLPARYSECYAQGTATDGIESGLQSVTCICYAERTATYKKFSAIHSQT